MTSGDLEEPTVYRHPSGGRQSPWQRTGLGVAASLHCSAGERGNGSLTPSHHHTLTLHIHTPHIITPPHLHTQHIFEVFGLSAVVGGGFKQSGIAENSSLVSHHHSYSYRVKLGSLLHCVCVCVCVQALVVVEKRATIVDLTQRLQEVFKSTR